MREELKLENIRSNLIRLEETIIFSLIERAQFAQNKIIYRTNGIPIKNYSGSFMLYLLSGTEKLHAMVRRYTAPDEHPFTEVPKEQLLSPLAYEWPIKKTEININAEILETYIDKIIPLICKKEDDGNYGSSSVNDISTLQAFSKRIHYGKYVAEAKFQDSSLEYTKLIKASDSGAIMQRLTDKKVEEHLLERVSLKAQTYGQEPDVKNPVFKINPEIIKKIYADYIIPFTKKVELLYLLERTD